jgi:pyrroloquinoline quinone biosynthesis protein B
MLQRVPNQTVWSDFLPGNEFSLSDVHGRDSGLLCRAWSLSPHYPAYVTQERRAQLDPREASLGFIFREQDNHASAGASGSRFAFLPAVPEIDDGLLEQLESCDVILFDGTFWSDDELIRVQGSGHTALQMGHVPVEITLNKLAGLRRPRKIFLHINNTNPMLDQASAQSRQVRGAGWEIAEDGWQFNL